MGLFEEFARRYLAESKRDVERALRALEVSDYPQATFYAQQSVDKAVKSMLEAKKKVVYNHGPELASVFIEVISGEWRSEYDIVIEALEYVSEYYTRSRYPSLFRGRVYSPEEVVTEEIARRAIFYARKTIEVAERFLRGEGII